MDRGSAVTWRPSAILVLAVELDLGTNDAFDRVGTWWILVLDRPRASRRSQASGRDHSFTLEAVDGARPRAGVRKGYVHAIVIEAYASGRLQRTYAKARARPGCSRIERTLGMIAA